MEVNTHDKSKCPECGASLSAYKYTLDCLDALLVHGMGKIVQERIASGMSLTEANRVHIQTELNTYYSVPSRSTQCSKLGLIAKVLHDDGTHNTKAGWAITKRGFDLLAGREVPKYVTVFRNKIVQHHDEVTTIKQAFQEHVDLVTKSKNPRNDYTSEINNYKSEWYETIPMYIRSH